MAEETKLVFGSKEYQEHIVSQMIEGDEVISKDGGKKIPKAMGLWAVCIRELGVLECDTEVVQAPPGTINNPAQTSATVVARVRLTPYMNGHYPLDHAHAVAVENGKISKEDRLLSGAVFEFSGVFDMGSYNNPDFYEFLTSTAETIAIGRALKKAMCINCHTNEELADLNRIKENRKNYQADAPIPTASNISPPQKKLITSQIQSLNADFKKVLNKIVGQEDFSGLTKDQANDILHKLVEWDSKGKAPDSVLSK